MIQNSLTNVGYPNYNQNSFDINPFRNKAIELVGKHDVIKTLNEELENFVDYKNFNRQNLIDIWRNEQVSFSSKIILTFWWGGISHQNQAPLFYNALNLNKISEFSKDLKIDLFEISKLQDIEQVKKQLQFLYQKLRVKGESFKMNGISTSFFTKLFQFFFEAYGTQQIRECLPIIADKWTMRAVLADMLNNQNNNWQNIFRKPIWNNKSNDFEIYFKGSPKTEFDKYWQFIIYFNNKVNHIKNQNIDISAFQLEEIIFGWAKDIENKNNPRCVSSSIIKNNFFN